MKLSGITYAGFICIKNNEGEKGKETIYARNLFA